MTSEGPHQATISRCHRLGQCLVHAGKGQHLQNVEVGKVVEAEDVGIHDRAGGYQRPKQVPEIVRAAPHLGSQSWTDLLPEPPQPHFDRLRRGTQIDSDRSARTAYQILSLLMDRLTTLKCGCHGVIRRETLSSSTCVGPSPWYNTYQHRRPRDSLIQGPVECTVP